MKLITNIEHQTPNNEVNQLLRYLIFNIWYSIFLLLNLLLRTYENVKF